jgi:GAF domain-containing protein
MIDNGRVSEVFVEFADTLIADFDLIDFLDRVCNRCVETLGVDAAGLTLVGPDGRPRFVAASSEESRLVELVQHQYSEGPCFDAIVRGEPVKVESAPEIRRRWPAIAVRVDGLFESVYALPLRLRSEIIGGLNLFGRRPASMSAEGFRIAQALADTATIGIIQQRAVREGHLLSEQLQMALNTRIVIEQAKGVYAERHRTGMATAWNALRQYARDHNLSVHDVASGVVNRSLDVGTPDRPTS